MCLNSELVKPNLIECRAKGKDKKNTVEMRYEECDEKGTKKKQEK